MRRCHATDSTDSGSFAKFAAIRLASSFVSSLAADRRPGSSSVQYSPLEPDQRTHWPRFYC
jgi:hypothetical protein